MRIEDVKTKVKVSPVFYADRDVCYLDRADAAKARGLVEQAIAAVLAIKGIRWSFNADRPC